MAKSKKGAEMTVGTIIIIVLALIVLVVLVVGFTGGWTNLWGRITSFFGGANVDSIVQACQMACTTNQKYEFCDRGRKVTFGDTELDKDKTKTYTCYQLANNIPKSVGVASCGSVECAFVSCDGLGESECAGKGDKCAVHWTSKSNFDAVKKIASETHEEYSDITYKVTDLADLNANAGQVCVKETVK